MTVEAPSAEWRPKAEGLHQLGSFQKSGAPNMYIHEHIFIYVQQSGALNIYIYIYIYTYLQYAICYRPL